MTYYDLSDRLSRAAFISEHYCIAHQIKDDARIHLILQVLMADLFAAGCIMPYITLGAHGQRNRPIVLLKWLISHKWHDTCAIPDSENVLATIQVIRLSVTGRYLVTQPWTKNEAACTRITASIGLAEHFR